MHGRFGTLVYHIPVNRLAASLQEAHEAAEERKAWELYLSVYPYMIIPLPPNKRPSLRFKKFSEFFDVQTTPQTQETAEEIIERFKKYK